MRLTRPGADQTPEGSEPYSCENDCATVVSATGTSAHLAQPGGDGLGGDVVDPGADPGLGPGEVLQPSRRAQHGHDLQVQPGDVAPLANRRLVPAGDVWQ